MTRSLQLSTQILSFDNFAALESHLKATREKYHLLTRRYEEVLGDLLREFRPTPTKGKSQEQWAINIKQTLNSKDARKKVKPLKENKNKKDGDNDEEWVSLDTMSVFVGRTNRGIAELYFDAINQLRDDIAKIDSAISLAGKLKSKSSSANNASLIVSVINDIPTKIVVKSASENPKKYSLSCELVVPAA